MPFSSAHYALKEKLRRKSDELGFHIMRVASANLDDGNIMGMRLQNWIELKRHGSMHYMEKRCDERASPRHLWPEAASLIMFAMGYKPLFSPLESLSSKNRGLIASYAQRRDYHDIVKGKLKEFGRFLCTLTTAEIRIFVDTGPLMEKPLAQISGIGWQGKHTILVSRHSGPWMVLGAVLTSLNLPPDKPENNHCGTCRKCLDICPVQAFPAPYQFDARRCIAYYTTEAKDLAPRELRPLFGNRIFGCDDCVAVCPWNKYARSCHEIRFAVREELVLPPLSDLLKLDDIHFRSLFSKNPVKRIGRDRFLRNVLVAAGNACDPALLPAITALLKDPSSLVRAMAVWALIRTDPVKARNIASHSFSLEQDDLVREEWQNLF